MKEEERKHLIILADEHYEKYSTLMMESEKMRNEGKFKLAAKTLRTAALELEIVDLLNTKYVWGE